MTTTTEVKTDETPRLSIKGIVGSIENEHVGQLRPTPKDTPVSEMRQRFREDGYLFVKNVIPRADVLNVRKHYFEDFEELGMLEPGTTPEEGIFNASASPEEFLGLGAGRLPPSDEKVQRLVEAHHKPDYIQFLESPALRQMVRDLMGWKKDILLPRTLLRHNNPGSVSTGVHYDKLFLRKGGSYFLTAWIPIGDLALHGGGLMYLSNSASLGREIEADFNARAASFPESERISAFNVNMGDFGFLSNNAGEFHAKEAKGQGKWLISEYEAGDVVFHDPYMIHGSSSNQDENRKIRLSTDIRFNEEGSDLDDRWMSRWNPKDGL